MRAATPFVYFAILAAAWPSIVMAEDAPPALSHNPFSRPSSDAMREVQGVVESEDGSAPTLALHATMIGRINRLANIGGRILKEGDEYQGYRLVEIHERHAVFERDGRITTIYVRPDQVENDE